MQTLVTFSIRVKREELGQDIIEYVFLVGLISVIAIGAMILAGGAINALWAAVTAAIGTATAAI